MNRQPYRCGIPLVIALLFACPQVADAAGLLDQTGCSACCPACNHCCKLKVEKGDVEKKTFDVETKVICIPRVVFPWQNEKKQQCASCDSCSGGGCSSCVHNGARTRTICVLKSKTIKCPKCKYTWSAEPKNGGRGCASGGCASGCSSSHGACASTTARKPTTADKPTAPNFVEAPKAVAEEVAARESAMFPPLVAAKLPAALK